MNFNIEPELTSTRFLPKDTKLNLLDRMKREMKTPIDRIYLKSQYIVNSGTSFQFDDLYHILCRTSVLIQALGNISKSKGRLTPGVDPEDTIDGASLERIDQISTQLKDKTFRFSPVKRIYVPKPGKKVLRPIGIPTFTDKIVQEAIRIILEAIYEPIFEEKNFNHGFRPRKSAHSAMTSIKVPANGSKLALEGDIEGAYNNVDHKVLIKIIEKRVMDRNFLNLIDQGLKSGMLEFGVYKDTLIGTPQGGIVSPLLFNIYMHEFDSFIDTTITSLVEEKNKKEGRTARPRPKAYQNICYEISTLRNRYEKIKGGKKWLDTPISAVRRLIILRSQLRLSLFRRTKIPSIYDKGRSIFFTYVRYADDWILLTNADRKFLSFLKETISKWLESTLYLKLSPEKTIITNLKTEKARFLGFTIYRYRNPRIQRNKKGEPGRISGGNILFNIDDTRVLPRLFQRGFCREQDFRPIAKSPFTVLALEEIVSRFNSIIRGTVNYFGPVTDRVAILQRIHYILEYSCYMTIAKKLSSNTAKTMKRFGRPLTIQISELISLKKSKTRLVETSVYREKKIVLLNYSAVQRIRDLARDKFLENMKKRKIINPVSSDIFSPLTSINWRTARNLTSVCAICGTLTNVEMHHVKAIRKGKTTGFGQVMKQLNRTMIPLCRTHHTEVEHGKYDSTKIEDLIDVDRFLM